MDVIALYAILGNVVWMEENEDMLTLDLARDLRKQYITNYGCEPQFIEASLHDPVPQGFLHDGYNFIFGNIRIYLVNYISSGEINLSSAGKPTLSWRRDAMNTPHLLDYGSTNLNDLKLEHIHKWSKY